MKHTRKATLNLDNGSQPLEFPILSGSMGPDVVDIRTLYAKAVYLPMIPAIFPPPAAVPG